MIKWLTRNDQARPLRLDAAPKRPKGQALVETNLDAGSIILLGPGGDTAALVWKLDDKDRRRALPPGAYRLRTTRIERLTGKDHWFLSSTGPPGAERVLKADKTARIDVDDTVQFKAGARRNGGRLQLNFVIFGADHRGLSVYKNDKRVPVTWKQLSKKGKTLASGKMNYG